jgi:hypothetical protein
MEKVELQRKWASSQDPAAEDPTWDLGGSFLGTAGLEWAEWGWGLGWT